MGNTNIAYNPVARFYLRNTVIDHLGFMEAKLSTVDLNEQNI